MKTHSFSSRSVPMFFLVLLLIGCFLSASAQNRLVLPVGSSASDDGNYVSPSGKLIAIAYFRDNIINVYNTRTGQLIASLSDPEAYRGFELIEFTANEARLVSKSKEHQDIRIWDLAKAKCIYSPNTPIKEAYKGLQGTYFSEKARKILKLQPDKIQIFDGSTFILEHELNISGVEGFSLSPTGKFLSLSMKGEIRTFDTKTWLTTLPSIKINGKISFSDDDTFAVIYSAHQLNIYDLKVKKLISERSLDYKKPRVEVMKTGEIILTSDGDYMERFDPLSGQWKRFPENKGINLDPIGEFMVITPAHETDSITVMDQRSLKNLFYAASQDELYFSRSGKYLIQLRQLTDTTKSDLPLDSTIVWIWERDLKTLAGFWRTKANQPVTYDPTLDKMISRGLKISIYDNLSGRVASEILTTGRVGYAGALKLSPDGNTLSANSTYLWDTHTMQLKFADHFQEGSAVDDILFSEDSRFAITSATSEDMKTYSWSYWDLRQKLLLTSQKYTLSEETKVLKAIQGNGKTMAIAVTGSPGKLILFNQKDLEHPIELQLDSSNIESLHISPEGSYLLISHSPTDNQPSGQIEILPMIATSDVKFITGRIPNSAAGIFNGNGKKLVTTTGNEIIIYDTQTWKGIQRFKAKSYTSPHFSWDGRYVFSDSFFDIFNIKVPKASPTLPYEADLDEFEDIKDVPMMLSRDGKRVINSFFYDGGSIGQGKSSNIWDITNGKNLLPKKQMFLENIHSNHQGTSIYTIDYSNIGRSYLYNINSLAKIYLRPFSSKSTDATFTLDDRNLLVSTDGELARFNSSNGKLISKSYAIDQSDYITTLPTGYYMATPNAAKSLHYVTPSLQTITFDQLDIKFNRPDLVLQALGCKDTTLINSYKRAYEKRIRKLGIDTTAFRAGFAAPTADFLNRDGISYEQHQKQLSLRISGQDPNGILERFNVWINENPLYGARGISLKGRSAGKLDTTIVIELSDFANKIETSITNTNGIESYRIPLYINYTPKSPSQERLYFVGIGINHFVDSTKNLNWSVKDIRDIALALSQKYGPNCIIDTLFDQDVTLEKVRALKKRLYQTGINDKIILAYSGHGMLNVDFDYFLSTYGIDFLRPEIAGLPYDVLEDLFDQIPARRKLILIDACNSGEVDKEEMIRYSEVSPTLANNHIKNSKGISIINNQKRVGIKNSLEIMQLLFANVNRNTGATIISAAGGTQFALEKDNLKNGVFSYAILELIREKAHMTVSELKSHINKRVVELTAGMQRPTTRSETNAQDWQVW